MTRPFAVGLLTTMALAALLGAGGEPWKDKAASEWTQEEATRVLTHSPWGQEVELLQASGRMLARLPDGRKLVYQEARNLPPRQLSVEPVAIEPEFVQAVYGVRWSSAATVQAALGRLQEFSPVLADVQAVPPELSADHYVLTVRVVKPPSETQFDALNREVTYRDEHGNLRRDEPPSVSDLFAGLSADQLKTQAELRTAKKLRLKPDRALRHGVGISEGISFFFPRRQDGQETLPAGTDWAEFVFAGGRELKVKFKLKEMQANGKADY